MSQHRDIHGIENLWKHAGLDMKSLSRLQITNQRFQFSSSFAITSAAVISIACSALAASDIYQLRMNKKETNDKVIIDRCNASIEFISERYMQRNAKELKKVELWDPLSGFYRIHQNGGIRLHANFPHHREGLLRFFQCHTVNQVKDKIKEIKLTEVFDIEEKATASGLCVSVFRTLEEWNTHPHGIHLQEIFQQNEQSPILYTQETVATDTTSSEDIEILKKTYQPFWTRIKDMTVPPRNCLEGLRVLSLTHVIAGPVAGRTLASHGADVLWVTCPSRPNFEDLDIDTSRGKRTLQLDFNNEDDHKTMKKLIATADVLLMSYRAGCFDKFGFSVENLQKLNPNLIIGNVSAYGNTGPWAKKRGFDSLVQTATGLNAEEGKAFAKESDLKEAPAKALPAQALDHATGYLLAFGVLADLIKRVKEGDQKQLTQVHVPLALTGEWLKSLGRTLSDVESGTQQLSQEMIDSYCERVQRNDWPDQDVSTELSESIFVKRTPEMVPSPSFETYPNGYNSSTPTWL